MLLSPAMLLTAPFDSLQKSCSLVACCSCCCCGPQGFEFSFCASSHGTQESFDLSMPPFPCYPSSSLTLFKPLDWLEVLGFKWSLEISLLLPAPSASTLLHPPPSMFTCGWCGRTTRLCQIMIMIIWLDWLLERHDATAGVMEFFLRAYPKA